MAKLAYGVSYWALGPFRDLVPCRCNERGYRNPSYRVLTRTKNDSTSAKVKVVSINITCDNCGGKTNKDVESMNIFEEDLDF